MGARFAGSSWPAVSSWSPRRRGPSSRTRLPAIAADYADRGRRAEAAAERAQARLGGEAVARVVATRRRPAAGKRRGTARPACPCGSGARASRRPARSRSRRFAEQVARQVLADHLALLAPGAALVDFELVVEPSRRRHPLGRLRRSARAACACVGGQVSFRFKHDRLFVIGSEALPNVTVAYAATRGSRARSSRRERRRAAQRRSGCPTATVSRARRRGRSCRCRRRRACSAIGSCGR